MKRSRLPLLFALLLASTAASAQTSPNLPSGPSIATDHNSALEGSARASKLVGTRIYQGDTTVGQIEDLLVDFAHGTLTAVVISVGGFLGLGEKLVALPPYQIQISSEARFTTNLTKDQLASLPAFDYGKVKQ